MTTWFDPLTETPEGRLLKQVLDLENRLIKPSSAEYLRREVVVAEVVNDSPT